MSRRDLVGVLLRRWPVVVLVAAAVFGVVVAIFGVDGDLYAARTSVVVRSDDRRLDLRLAYYSAALVSGNYNPYADYFAVRARGSGEAGSRAGELRTTTIVGNDQVTVEIVGLSGTPRGAVELAGSAADDFVGWVSSAGPGPLSKAPTVRARITEPAGPPVGPAGPSTGLVVLVGVVAAAALGVAGGLAVEAGGRQWDRRRRCADSA